MKEEGQELNWVLCGEETSWVSDRVIVLGVGGPLIQALENLGRIYSSLI